VLQQARARVRRIGSGEPVITANQSLPMCLQQRYLQGDIVMSKSLGVTGLPTLIVVKQGQEVQRLRGAAPKRALREAFDALLAS
jgi:hypothetical protein